MAEHCSWFWCRQLLHNCQAVLMVVCSPHLDLSIALAVCVNKHSCWCPHMDRRSR
jgi:hypothetical protein